MTKKLLLSNIAYGDVYTHLFLHNYTKTLVDDSNLPELKRRGYEIRFRLMSEPSQLDKLKASKHFQKLLELAEVDVIMTHGLSYDNRYKGLQVLLKDTITEAHKWGSLASMLVADIVFAKGALLKMVEPIERGHDATYCIPMRATADILNHETFNNPEAEKPMVLFEKCFRVMHPLWVACHFDSPAFTKMPYNLIWSTQKGMIQRNFSVTPVCFKTNDAMAQDKKLWMIDGDLPRHFSNPFVANDWLDCPIGAYEPLAAYYPPFGFRSDNREEATKIKYIKEWASQATTPNQKDSIQYKWYFPSKAFLSEGFDVDSLDRKADLVVNQIINE